MSVICNVALAFFLIVLGINTGLYLWRARLLRGLPACDAIDALGALHAIRAFAQECLAFAAAVLSIPAGWVLPQCRAGQALHGPIILMHDWGLNAGSLWSLRRRLLHGGWGPICCFRGPRGNNIEGAAERLREMIHHVAPGQQPLTLISHGVGGLVVRYCLRRYSIPMVRRIITLGTPHFGTALARVAPWHHSLSPGAPLLNKLSAADHVPQQFDVIAIHSTFDAVVLPPINAAYPGAFNIQLNDVGHTALLFSAKVYRLIAENLAAPLR